MKRSVLVTLIIPHKNSWELLKRLLDSIPANWPMEVLVVDDHSEFPIRAQSLPRENLRVVPNRTERHGAGAARNIALDLALGDWIMFADTDDVFTADAFSILEQHLASDADVVFFRPTSRWEGTNAMAERHRAYAALVKEYENWGSEWIRYRFHVCWSKLIRRSLIDRHGLTFDQTLVANDLVFSLRVGLLARKIQVVDETIYCVTQSAPGNLSSLRGEEFFDIRLDRHRAYNQTLTEHGLSSHRMAMLSNLKKALAFGPQKFLQVVWYCIRHRQPFVDHWHYVLMLWRRRFLKHRYR